MVDKLGELLSETTKLSVIFDMPATIDSAIAKLQDDIANQFDDIIKQEDDFHLTIAVAMNIDSTRLDELVSKLKTVCSGLKLDLVIGPIQDMENHKGEGVVYLKAENEQLFNLHAKVKKLLEEYGGTFSYPEFKGHVTLVYLKEPMTAEQKSIVDDIPFNETVVLAPQHLRISIKEGEDWRRIGRLQISKRDLI